MIQIFIIKIIQIGGIMVAKIPLIIEISIIQIMKVIFLYPKLINQV